VMLVLIFNFFKSTLRLFQMLLHIRVKLLSTNILPFNTNNCLMHPSSYVHEVIIFY
jgi:hypothetical protein